MTPAALRAPELILGRPFDTGIDIWCIGCLIFELLTDQKLFTVDHLGGDDWDECINDEHLIQLTEILQPLPDSLRAEWIRASQYYGPDGERLDAGSDDDMEDFDSSLEGEADVEEDAPVPLATPPRFDSLETRFREAKPPDIDAREETETVLFLRRILQHDPSQRPSAADLLKDPWFQDTRKNPAAQYAAGR